MLGNIGSLRTAVKVTVILLVSVVTLILCCLFVSIGLVMVNENVDVTNGVASGTHTRIIQIKLKCGEQPNLVQMDYIHIPAVHAHQIEFLLLKHKM